jgi:hypothetical protein
MSSYSASLAEPFPPPIQGCIFVQTSTGETIEIKVPVKDTVWSVYKKIQDQFDIKPHLQQWVVKQWAATDLLAMQTTEQDDEGSQR